MSYQCWIQGKDHISQPAGSAFSDASPEADGHLCHKGALLDPVQLSFYWNTQIFSCSAAFKLVSPVLPEPCWFRLAFSAFSVFFFFLCLMCLWQLFLCADYLVILHNYTIELIKLSSWNHVLWKAVHRRRLSEACTKMEHVTHLTYWGLFPPFFSRLNVK